MAAFSTAANAFSVVGLADVVFRLGVDTASLYSRFRNASKDIASLVDEIKAFVEIIAQIRVYLDEYRQSPYAQSDGQSLMLQLSKILSDCEKELRDIQQLANKHKREPNDGLAMQMMKSWGWTLQNKQVSECCKRIRLLNTNLQTILIFIGRKNEIVLSKELKETRAEINTAGLTVHQALHTMEGTLDSNQERTNALVRNQTTLISQMIKQSEDHHLSLESNIYLKQEKSNTLIHNQTTLINQMIKISEDHHQELLERIPNLTLEQIEDDDFIFQGDNLGSIVFPLLLMKSDLFKTVQTLQKEGVLKVSRSEAEWILQHFDKLIARGHEAAARDLKRRPWNDRSRSIPGSFNMKQRKPSSKQGPQHLAEDTKVSAFDQIGRIEHTSTIYTPSGVLVLQTGSSNKPIQHHQNSADLQVIRLSFFPKPEFSMVNLCMLMTNDFGRNAELEIPRLIQTYNTIPWESETSNLIRRLIREDDARGLRNVFKDGGGSPNDIFESGLSLSVVAAGLQSIAVCEFLFREGASTSMLVPFAGIASIGSVTSVLHVIWSVLGDRIRHKPYLTQLTAIENSVQLSHLAVKHGCDPNLISFPSKRNVIQEFILAFYETIEDAVFSGNYNCVQLPINKFREIFSCMVGMGCELEGRDTYGHTALIWACILGQLDMITALIDIGAHINTTSDTGNSVLHCFLAVGERIRRYDDNSLYRGLVFLLSQKVDPNHLNNEGHSPSDYACGSPTRLDMWIKAVKDAGYDTLWIKRKHCEHEEEILVVVSAGSGPSDSTLPISNMTLDKWLEKRFGGRQPFGCPECQTNEVYGAIEEI